MRWRRSKRCKSHVATAPAGSNSYVARFDNSLLKCDLNEWQQETASILTALRVADGGVYLLAHLMSEEFSDACFPNLTST